MLLSVICWQKQWPEYPVEGDWCIDGNEMKVWVDASSVATGVALGVNGSFVENACWMHPINDAWHVNLAKLDAVIKKVNLALQWPARVLHVVSDSACIHRWVSNTLTGKVRVNTKVVLGNAASFGREVPADNGHKIGEILSKLRWQPHQSATKVTRSAQERRRTDAGKLCCSNEPIKQKSGGWHPSKEWPPGC